MSDFSWFALECIVFLILIGFVCYLTTSAMPLLALLIMPSFSDKEEDSQ